MRKPKRLIPVQRKQLTQKMAIQAISPAQIEQIKKIANDLASDSSRARRYAAFALNKIGLKEATPPLIELLTNSDPQVRSFAAYTLGKMGANAEEAVLKLTELLKDPNMDVRFNAAAALKRIGTKKTAAILKKRLYPELKKLISLIANLEPRKSASIPGWYKAQLNFIEALSKLGADAIEAVPVLERLALKDPNQQVLRADLEARKDLTPEVRNIMLKARKDRDQQVSSAALEALEKITGRKYHVRKYRVE